MIRVSCSLYSTLSSNRSSRSAAFPTCTFPGGILPPVEDEEIFFESTARVDQCAKHGRREFGQRGEVKFVTSWSVLCGIFQHKLSQLISGKHKRCSFLVLANRVCCSRRCAASVSYLSVGNSFSLALSDDSRQKISIYLCDAPPPS